MNDSLPTSWAKATLGEISDIWSGYGFPEHLQGRTEGEVPFFKVGDISEAWKRNEIFLFRANHYLTNDEMNELRATPLPRRQQFSQKLVPQ
jgi:type I restriction enzyme, S subunit